MEISEAAIKAVAKAEPGSIRCTSCGNEVNMMSELIPGKLPTGNMCLHKKSGRRFVRRSH